MSEHHYIHIITSYNSWSISWCFDVFAIPRNIECQLAMFQSATSTLTNTLNSTASMATGNNNSTTVYLIPQTYQD
jgi:hypothetical protein